MRGFCWVHCDSGALKPPGGQAAAQARRTPREDLQLQGPVQKTFLQLWTGGPGQKQTPNQGRHGDNSSWRVSRPGNDSVERSGAGARPGLGISGTGLDPGAWK